MFIETWHTYSLTEESLGPVAADLSDELAEWVLRMGKNPKDMPEWGVLCPPMGENDPRVYFRQLEVEVGYTFSALAAADVLGSDRQVVSMIDADSVSAVKKQLRALNSGIFWEKEPETLIEALTAARFPHEQLPLAADEGDATIISGKLIKLQEGAIVELRALSVEIFRVFRSRGEVKWFGSIQELPEKMEDARLLCTVTADRKVRAEAVVREWNPQTGSFLASFAPDVSRRMTLEIAVIYSQKE